MNTEERAEAPITAVELHVHQPAGDGVESRAAVTLDVLADDPELADALDQRPRHLGLLPVATDHGEHVRVDERANAAQHIELVLGQLLTHEEVIGGARLPEMIGQSATHAAFLDR